MSDQPAKPVGPAALYSHDHAPVFNVNEVHVTKRTLGQRVADMVAALVGSWPFILVQSFILLCWITGNIYLAMHYKDKAFDPFPFILLNLVLSFQAAYTGPIVMMSQNRQSEKDRLMAEADFQTNTKAEEELRVVMDHLVHQDQVFHQREEEEMQFLIVRLSKQDELLQSLLEEVQAIRAGK